MQFSTPTSLNLFTQQNPLVLAFKSHQNNNSIFNTETQSEQISDFIFQLSSTLLILILLSLIIYHWQKKIKLKRILNNKINALTIAYNREHENNLALEEKVKSRTEEVIDQINKHDDIVSKLNLSELKFEKIFSTNRDGMVLVDFDTLMVVDINKSAMEMFGVSKNRDGNSSFLNLKTETSNFFLLKVASIIKYHQEVTDYIIAQNISPSNQKWFSITSQIITINSKKYYFVTASNITKPKKAELSLIENEKRFKMLTENINDMIWLIDPKLHISYISPSVYINLGYKASELLNQPITRILTQNSYVKFKESIFEFSSNKNNRSTITLEIEFKHKDGSIQLAEFRAKLVEQNYNQWIIHGVSRDITEKVKTELALRKSEQLYRLITNNVSDVIFTSDTSLNIKYSNHAILTFLGYDSDEIIDTSLEKYIRGVSLEKLSNDLTSYFGNLFQRERAENKVIFESEIEFISKTNESKWGFLQINLLLDENHYIFGLIGTIRDISETYQLEVEKRTSSDFFKKLFFESPIMMVIVDSRGAIVNGNNEFLKKLDLPFNKKINEPFTAFFKSGGNSFAENFVGKTDRSEVGQITTKNGTIIDVIFDIEAMNSSDNENNFLIVMRDITPQVEAQKAAIERQEQFKALSENSPDVIGRFNNAIECTYVNPIAEKEFLLSPAQIIGKNIKNIGFSDSESENLYNNFTQVFIDGNEKTIEFMLNINNEEKHYQSRIIPEFSGKDQVQSIMVVTRNITEYHRAINMLQTNIQQMAFINKAIIYCNQSESLKELYKNIFKLIIQEYGFNGGAIYEFDNTSKNAHLVFEENLSKEFVKEVSLITESNPFYNDLYVRRKAVFCNNNDDRIKGWGQKYDITSVFGIPILNKDKVIGSINLKGDKNLHMDDSNTNVLRTLSQEIGSAIERIQAITMHLESEDSYKSLVETTSDLVWKTDKNFGFTFLSSKSQDLLGFSPSELIGSNFIDVVTTEEHLKIKKFLEMNKVLLEKFTLVEVPLVHKSGQIIYVEINGYPLIDSNGKFTGYAGINRDISIRKVNEDLRHRKEIAERMAQVKQQFVSNISHEFRTPLTAIIGHSEIINHKIGDSEIKNHVRIIQSNSKSLLRLINDILDLSKIEAGKFSLQNESINLYKFFDDIKLSFAPLAKAKNIDFLIDINPSNFTSVFIDELRLRQIVNNIVANAIKFTDIGQVKIEVKLLHNESEESTIDLVINVIDTGIGIAPDQLDSIWDSFSQADGQSNKKYGGTGLGLSICKNLIELMQGSIALESKEQHGTTFRIILPSIKISHEKAKNEMYNPLLNNKTITIIDSTKDLATELTSTLSINNCQIEYVDYQLIESKTSNITDSDLTIINYAHLTESTTSENVLSSIEKFKSQSIFIVADQSESLFKHTLTYPFEQKKLHDILLITLNDLMAIDKGLDFDLIQDEIKKLGQEKVDQMIDEMINTCSALWEKASTSNSIDQITQFQKAVYKIGKSKNVNFLKQYSHEIIVGLKSFDIERLKILLNLYPQIIKYLQKQ